MSKLSTGFSANSALGRALVILCTGCTLLSPKAPAPLARYTLTGGAPSATHPAPLPLNAPTLLVEPVTALAGFDSRRMIYQTAPDRIEAFATRQWVDTPAEMLKPIIVAELRGGTGLLHVTEAPTGMVSDVILNAQIMELEQDFTVTPSQTRFKLSAVLTESKTGRQWASRDFEGAVTVAGDGSEASVAAANQVVALVLGQLGGFCEAELARWQSQHKP